MNVGNFFFWDGTHHHKSQKFLRVKWGTPSGSVECTTGGGRLDFNLKMSMGKSEAPICDPV